MNANPRAELVAPAGDPDAGFAALHYGADALYLGLGGFSARAGAVNFTVAQLGEMVAYAHSLTPRRSVYVTLNTLLLQHELREFVAAVGAACEAQADAVIVQDLGAARIIREYFPFVRMHASTQMAVHNLSGALALADLGFRRVVLARELTLDEIEHIASGAAIETEVFIHGALCYSYSGLCLFSSMSRGQSGNRGRCKQPCRTPCRSGGEADGFDFSMKDLCLGDRVRDVRRAGATAFKIEGRMKSALYTATVVHTYRRLLDGTLSPDDARAAEDDMRTVFARPWTQLYLDSPRARNVTDENTLGHRGVRIGTVLDVRRTGDQADIIRFSSNRALEVHDGIQVDLPTRGRPFGFAVNELRVVGADGRPGALCFEAPPDSVVDVPLPREHSAIPAGAPVYCGSSQRVKRNYPFPRPKRGAYRRRRALNVRVSIFGDRVEVTGEALPARPEEAEQRAAVSVAGTFTKARDASATAGAARAAFEKLGNTRLKLAAWVYENPDDLFVPVSLLNQARRMLVQHIEDAVERAQQERIRVIGEAVSPAVPVTVRPPSRESWAICVQRIEQLSAMERSDWEGIDEVVFDLSILGDETPEDVPERLEDLCGRDYIRFGLPVIARQDDEDMLCTKMRQWIDAGWTRWQIPNVAGLHMLGLSSAKTRHLRPSLDVIADWPLYTTNSQTAQSLQELGLSGFTLSPEDGHENLHGLIAEFGIRCSVILRQDTPLFLSATRIAGRRDACAEKGSPGGPRSLMLESGERVRAITTARHTVVIPEEPFCIADRLDVLRAMGARRFRADFVWRDYAPERVRDAWRAIRTGHGSAGMCGNFDRGLA